MKVDLPDPEGPITATNSPGWMRIDTPRRAWMRRAPRW